MRVIMVVARGLLGRCAYLSAIERRELQRRKVALVPIEDGTQGQGGSAYIEQRALHRVGQEALHAVVLLRLDQAADCSGRMSQPTTVQCVRDC